MGFQSKIQTTGLGLATLTPPPPPVRSGPGAQAPVMGVAESDLQNLQVHHSSSVLLSTLRWTLYSDGGPQRERQCNLLV